MPIGRRVTTRPGNQSATALSLKSNDSSAHPPFIKHVPFPLLPSHGGPVILFMHCALFLLSTMVQYLNLYKTVWWIPESPFNYAIDFSAIDHHILSHILLMGLTPSLYRIVLRFGSVILSTYPVIRILSGIPLFSVWMASVFYTGSRANTMGYTRLYCAYLNVLLLYLPTLAFLFYNVDQMTYLYHRMSFSHPKRPRKSGSPSVNLPAALTKMISKLFTVCSEWPGLTPTSVIFPVRYMTVYNRPSGNGNALVGSSTYHYAVEPNTKSSVLLRHQCLNPSAEHIREEVALFRRDFNLRLMDVLFNASYTVYYSCIIPVLFHKPNGPIYDASWCIQHALLTWSTTFLLFWYYHLPPDYLDMLHRSALHLGSWIPVDPSATLLQSSTWSPTQIYASGTLIKHVRGQFQAIEPSNAAEPGNVQHARFHSWFHSPLRISSLLMYISLAVPVGQLISLKWISEWYKLIGIIAIGVFGLYNHYVHIRAYTLFRRVYSIEEHQSKSVG